MKEITVNSNKKYNFVLAVIFIGSILLRLGLANYNREANDSHMPVVRFIMKNKSLPEKPDCSECFQPKLFHYTIAKILSFMRLDRIRDSDAQKVVAQFVNFLLGAFTLVVAWIFISKLPNIPSGLKIVGLALLAFNPQFIGINSQVTNDTFLILLCTLSIACAYFFLEKPNFIYFLLMVIFSALAIVTKTNGLITVIAIAISVFIKSIFPKINFNRELLFAVAYPVLVIILVLLNPLSQYIKNYQQYGSPVVLNIEPQQPPLFVEKTYISDAGILSIQDGFLTFKFGDLLKKPITYRVEESTKESHRTSLWTRLYGSANSAHFENYPPSWRLKDQTTYWVYRGIFILALLPVAIILIGAILEINLTIKGVLTRDLLLLNDASYGLFILLFVGHMLFIVLYAYEYRIYTVMKAVFIYPSLLAFLVFFIKGSLLISKRSQDKNWYIIVVALIMALLIFYILDVVILILQLLPNQAGLEIIADRLVSIWR